MKYISSPSEHTLEVKQSKFIAHLIPYDDFDDKLLQLKAEHPKARHFVVAWRYINAFEQVVEHSSDDGEPKGTSGKPSLAVLAGMGLINTAVIIVRYFGGTKLGTGGLVRAYSQACNEVIGSAELLDYIRPHFSSFSVAYSDISLIEYRLDEAGLVVKNKSFDAAGALFNVQGSQESMEGFLKENERLIRLKQP